MAIAIAMPGDITPGWLQIRSLRLDHEVLP
jgi:hypothetical protein